MYSFTYLLRINADPDLEIKTSEGETPLLRAVLARNAEIVELLLDKKRKLIHSTNNKGGKKNVFCTEISRKKLSWLAKIVTILVPPPLGKNSPPSGPTQLHIWTILPKSEQGRWYKDFNWFLDTALHIAMRTRSKAVVEVLLRHPKHGQLLYRPNNKVRIIRLNFCIYISRRGSLYHYCIIESQYQQQQQRRFQIYKHCVS